MSSEQEESMGLSLVKWHQIGGLIVKHVHHLSCSEVVARFWKEWQTCPVTDFSLEVWTLFFFSWTSALSHKVNISLFAKTEPVVCPLVLSQSENSAMLHLLCHEINTRFFATVDFVFKNFFITFPHPTGRNVAVWANLMFLSKNRSTQQPLANAFAVQLKVY